VDPNQKTMMVEGFVAAFAKAARVSDVPEEAITSDAREPSYMFLAAEWNRSTVSERAYLLASYLAASSRWRPMVSACRSRT
jgi:hypothetical protein